jgi:hypothetical protein
MWFRTISACSSCSNPVVPKTEQKKQFLDISPEFVNGGQARKSPLFTTLDLSRRVDVLLSEQSDGPGRCKSARVPKLTHPLRAISVNRGAG